MQSNLFFSLNKFHIFIDPLEQSKQIPKLTILKYLANILFRLDCLVVVNNTWMLHSTKDKPFDNCLMNFTLFHHSLFADYLQCVLSFRVLYLKYLSERPIGYFTNWFVGAIFKYLT